MNFLAALEEEVLTTPGDPPTLESAPAAQPLHFPGQPPKDDLPKSPQQLQVVVNKDIDFSVRVLIFIGNGNLCVLLDVC
jgi:hypothetical protein